MAHALAAPSLVTREAPPLSQVLAQWFRTWAKDLFDPYRPERHYMRGPGPKWHAKHGAPKREDAPQSAALGGLTRMAA